MENEKYQKELFEFEQPKKQWHRFGRFFQKTDFAVTLNAERLVFVLIGILMLIVVSFALGVERGRSQAAILPAAPKAAPQSPVVQTPVAQKNDKAPSMNIAPKSRTSAAPVKAAVDTSKTQTAPADKNKPYTIVAGAFTREDTAIKEINRLKAGGLEAFVYYSEPYYLACVGAFANKDSAQKVLGKVRQMHRDAYVRLK